VINRERINRQVGAALRRVRLDRGFKQYVVAQVVGIDPRVLSRIEHGERMPPPPLMENLLIVLKCSAEEFGSWFGPVADVTDIPALNRKGGRQRGSRSGH
jgi:transcriptional regulator with XRE-family HTH domain